MKHTFFLAAIIFGLCNCSTPKYVIKKQSDINKLNLTNTTINYIPIEDNDLSKSSILDSAYYLITNKHYTILKKHIRSLEKSGINTSDLYLSKTLLFIVNQDYSSASSSLNKVNEIDFSLLKSLLSVDLICELSKNNKSNYNEILKKYQAILDNYPDNTSLKEIINIRLRSLLYNNNNY